MGGMKEILLTDEPATGGVFYSINLQFHDPQAVILRIWEMIQTYSAGLFKSFKDKLDRILNNWFNFYSLAPVVLDLYTGVMYNNKSFISNSFLMLFTAVEAYHRMFLESNSPKKVQNLSHKKYLIEIIHKADFPALERKIKGMGKSERSPIR